MAYRRKQGGARAVVGEPADGVSTVGGADRNHGLQKVKLAGIRLSLKVSAQDTRSPQ